MIEIFKDNFAIGIYGINSVGKTVQSQMLMKYFPICELQSTDNLIKIYKSLNPHWPYTNSTSFTSWKVIGEKKKENIVNGFISYRDSVEEYINTLIRRIQSEKLTIIFDGIHFSPQSSNKHPDVNIIPILLIIQDESIHRQRIREKAQGRKELEELLLENIHTARKIQDFLISEAKDNNCLFIDTGKDTVEQTLEKIVDIIDDSRSYTRSN